MKIEKLPSGSYRVRKTVKGKTYSMTFDKRPTQKEIDEEIKKRTSGMYHGKMTFELASLSYIEARTNTISPSTIREYKGTLKRLSEPFKQLEIDSITTNDIQREINQLAKDRAPKTIRNYHGFIASVLGEFRPELALHTHLPQKDKKIPYIPTDEDIKAVLNKAKGTRYEVPILLGCASMRRGEICALEMSDIDFKTNTIHITKDTVLDENKKWVIKPPKNTESIRDIQVPDRVINAIKTNGLYKGHPNKITEFMETTQKQLGIPKFSLHKCRHYFASVAHEKGISDADIMATGGWKTDHVMKTVYRHSMQKDTSKVTDAIFKTLS